MAHRIIRPAPQATSLAYTTRPSLAIPASRLEIDAYSHHPPGMRPALALLFAVMLLAPARATETMTFTLGRLETSRACGAPCAEFVVAKGNIGRATAFGYFLARARSGGRDLPVILESPGGHLNGAVALARMWRQLGVTVVIASSIPTCSHSGRDRRCESADLADGIVTFGLAGGSACASACTILMAGAVRRIAAPKARFGIHTPSANLDSDSGRFVRSLGVTIEEIQRDAIHDLITRFGEFGVDPELGHRSGRTAFESVEWLDIEDARRYRLINAGIDDLDPASPLAALLKALDGR